MLGAACSKRHEEPAALSNGGAASVSIDAASPFPEPPNTTSPSIAVSNLSADIDFQTKHLDDPVLSGPLVTSLLMRAQFLGIIKDLETAQTLVDKGVIEHPKDPNAHLAKAGVAASFHEFGLASSEVERAAVLGSAFEVNRMKLPIALAMGKCEMAVGFGDKADDALPLDMATHAAIEQRRGNAAESERLFALARSRYRDVSPFAIGWMDFERARALDRQGDKTSASHYYQEAVSILPVYAHAVIHLTGSVPPARALELLAALDPGCDDPDALAAKADALRRAGRTDEAKLANDVARARFEELLRKHPLAFADHGAAYFMGMGKDLPRALTLAKQAAKNAPAEESLDMWLTAALALKLPIEACDAVKQAATIDCALGPDVKARFDAAKANCTK